MSKKESAAAADAPGVATTVAEPPPKTARPLRKPKSDPKSKPPPQYKVLLHNDDVNTFDYVIRKIVQLTPLNLEEALQRALEAHQTGVALLLVTHKERAELYVEQFTSCRLTATMEADE